MSKIQAKQAPAFAENDEENLVVQRPKIVNDSNKELRVELVNKAQQLQKYVHFEATMRPHIDKMAREIDMLVKTCDEHDRKINEFRNATKKEEEKRKASGPTQQTDEEREEKVKQIEQLEAVYQKLLAEKEFYLAKAREE